MAEGMDPVAVPAQPGQPAPPKNVSTNPLVNAVEKVMHFLHHSAVVVDDVFVRIFGKDRAQAFGHAAIAMLQSAAGKIAMDAVASYESASPALSGAEKRAQAFAKIKTDLTATEKTVPDQLINLLIELAVSALKGAIVLP